MAGDTTAMPTGQHGGAGEAQGALTIVVSTPSYRLSPNGSRNRYERAKLAMAARYEAALAARCASRDGPRWPTGPVRLSVEFILPKGARRLDDDGAIALLKSSCDGVQGIVISNDRQIVWGEIRWSRNPQLRAGMVRLTFESVEAA